MYQIDRVPKKKLEERYGIVRSALHTRISALRIKPKRVGNRSYVTKEQLQLLDDLHAHIQSGGTTAEFLDARGLSPTKLEAVPNGTSDTALTLSKFQTDVLMKLVSQFSSRLELVTQKDPLAYFDSLEKACQNHWLLSTAELADLLGLSAGTIRGYGESFEEAGFLFARAGTRAKGGTAWKIMKPVD